MKVAAMAGVALGLGCGILSGAEMKLGKHVFTLPEGFEIEQAAGPPLVDRPIVADFDEAGHLYVADSAGVNDNVQKQLEERPHRIVRLTDKDGDGIYDESVVFADRMMFPEGLLWHDGAVYCAAPPSIWKLEDTDGDGVADKRTEWFNVGTLTGCANDLHGPYLGPAGWIYWTKGAFAQLNLEMGDGSRLTDKAAHLFRARPDGSGLESFAAGGMDNPVDVTFSEAGDVFFSSTFLVNPGNGRRDGLIHAIYGSVFPKRHGVIEGLPRTGELMPALSHLGPAASSGLTAYRSQVFGEDFQGNLFSCLFNMRKVMRHELTSRGASYQAEDSDFVVSDQVDFHPTDVQEDADGSLLIIDTGGWYKLCCPTSVIAKPDVFGAIYRVRKTGAAALDDPRGLKIDWKARSIDQLAELLIDSRRVVRQRAIAALGSRGNAALPRLEEIVSQTENRDAALGALWAAARIRTPESAAIARAALASRFPEVQRAGAYVCGLERDQGSLAPLLGLLASAHQPVQREAATALGRLKNPAATEALLECENRPGNGQSAPDRHLEHALIYALIEINDPKRVREFLGAGGQSVWLRACWALDQMKDGKLTAEEALRGPATPIIKRHPEWEAEIAAYYEKLLQGAGSSRAGDSPPDGGVSEFIHLPKVARVVSGLLLGNDRLEKKALGELSSAIESAFADGSRPMPNELIPGLEKVILAGRSPGDESLFTTAILRGIGAGQLTPALEALLIQQAGDPGHPQHLVAIEILASCGRALPDQGFQTVQANLGAERWHEAARVISQAALTDRQKAGLTEFLPKAGVAQLGLLLEPFKKGGSVELGQRLAARLADSPAIRTVPADDLTKLADAFPESVRPAILDARPKDPGAEELEVRLEEMEAKLPEGDRRRGHQVFKSSKAACATCHRVAYDGGEIGPDLTRIGAIRSRRDLLEAIVAPSASYARGYEAMMVTTDEGTIHIGRLQHQKQSISLIDAAGRTTNISSNKIKKVDLFPASLMPAGIDQTLSPQELADLVVFLESLK